MLSELEKKIIEAKEIIGFAIKKYGKPIVAYSGGKDGTCIAHIVNSVYPNVEMICEISYYFPDQLKNIKEMSKQLNFNVKYTNTLSEDWLAKNKEYLFSSDKKIRSKSFLIRQQRAIKRFSKEMGAALTFTGRRTQENTVKSILYNTSKNGMQCHPLRNWKEKDVWDYFDYHNIQKPIIYQTPFGKTEGNAPFYSLNKKYFNGNIDQCWKVIRESGGSEFEQKYR